MNRDIDRIREKAGIDKLDIESRKKLFKEFIEHGGEVIEEKTFKKKPTKTTAIINGKKPKEHFPSKLPSTLPQRIVKTEVKQVKPAKKKIKTFDMLKIYMRGVIENVFTLSGKEFRESFIRFVDKEVKECLKDLHLTTKSMLKGGSEVRKEMVRLMVAKKSMIYEFLLRMKDLFDEKEFEVITGAIYRKSMPGKKYLPVFKQFCKRLYILSRYIDNCKLFIEDALELQLKRKVFEKELMPKLSSQLKKDLNIILLDFFPKFHIVLCRLAQKYFTLYTQELDDFLEITEEDKIGYITKLERKKRIEELRRREEYLKKQHEIATKQSKTQIPELKEEIKIPVHIQRGFPLVEQAVERYEKNHTSEENNRISRMHKNDKMYRATILLEVFEEEYSFILTTGKISFNIDYREQKKIDIKEDLSRAYLLLSEAREEVKDYLDIVEQVQKIEENIRLTSYQKTGMLKSLEKKRSLISRNARKKISESMKSIEDILSFVITDYNSTKRLLQNPEEILYFDRNVDGQKKMNGRKVIEAIIEAFLFSSTLAFLINYGELSGLGIFIHKEEEKKDT